ncbi:Hypothetical predicted protein [Marmota monax]|uniref:Uncharacterized protein n=1 Tax=Marmota monax TaxID=9995 RepID=A0A5E4BES6_MARMO|nr:hypothetical protein GHT09_002318 [Marmota monax]VTJ67411.1 Hypothetical predicted protein [Marmota monax]
MKVPVWTPSSYHAACGALPSARVEALKDTRVHSISNDKPRRNKKTDPQNSLEKKDVVTESVNSSENVVHSKE